MSKQKKNRWESAALNNETYIMYYNMLTSLAINMFEWKGLPDSVDPRFIEWVLYHDGYGVYFNDEILGNLFLQARIGGPLSVYRIPTRRCAYATNGYNKELGTNDSVIVYNNFIHTNTRRTIQQYALRLYEVQRAIDVNVKQQKTPLIIKCSENQRLTLKNFYMQYDGNEPFIFGDKNLDLDDVKVINTDSPYVSDKLEILKQQILNHAYNYIGIESSSSAKKERLTLQESNQLLGNVTAYRYARLNARREAAEQINEMFGTHITVDFRESVKETMQVEGINSKSERTETVYE